MFPGRFGEEHCAQPEPAADGLFHQLEAFNGDRAVLSRGALAEGAPELLDQRVLTALDGPQLRGVRSRIAGEIAERVGVGLGHAVWGRAVRVVIPGRESLPCKMQSRPAKTS